VASKWRARRIIQASYQLAPSLPPPVDGHARSVRLAELLPSISACGAAGGVHDGAAWRQQRSRSRSHSPCGGGRGAQWARDRAAEDSSGDEQHRAASAYARSVERPASIPEAAWQALDLPTQRAVAAQLRSAP
jgi:hypothetical protein